MLASFSFYALLIYILVGCDGSIDRAQTHKFAGSTMGTTYHVTLAKTGRLTPAEKDILTTSVDTLLVEINQQMSTYIVNSELNQLQSMPLNEWHEISDPLKEVLQISLEVFNVSGGAFDITLRPLIDLWGFGPLESHDTVPSQQTIDSTLQNVDSGAITLRSNPSSILRTKPVNMDLSAVAKGYAVDKVSALLIEKGYLDHMVEIGGELRLSGNSPRGEPWRIGIEKPQAGLSQSVQRAVSLTNIGMATSGDYRNYFEENGVRYSHTLDPRTGFPVRHNLASVTVLHASCAYADALATAFSVMGQEAAMKLANDNGIAALFLVKQGVGFVESTSEAFESYLLKP